MCVRPRPPDGGTAYLLFRKDRFTCTRGAEHLQGSKLREDSPTNRVVATCCNSAMYLGFDGGPHWVSAFRLRFEDAVPLQMRINTRFDPDFRDEGDVPGYATVPISFVAKLIGARIAMFFGR